MTNLLENVTSRNGLISKVIIKYLDNQQIKNAFHKSELKYKYCLSQRKPTIVKGNLNKMIFVQSNN